MHIALDDDTSKGAEEEACPGYQMVLAQPPISTKKYIIDINTAMVCLIVFGTSPIT